MHHINLVGAQLAMLLGVDRHMEKFNVQPWDRIHYRWTFPLHVTTLFIR